MAQTATNMADWRLPVVGGAPSFATLTFDGTADMASILIVCPKAGDLDRIEFNIAAITTWPTGGMKVAWEGLTETAQPSVPNGTATHSVTVTSSPGAGWWNPGSVLNAGARRTVSRGEVLFATLRVVSGTPNWTLNRVDDTATLPNGQNGNFYYGIVNVTGTDVITADIPVFALWYNGDTEPVFVHSMAWPVLAFSTQVVDSTTKYGGLLWTAPVDCKVRGMDVRCDTDAITKFLMCTTDATAPLASSAAWDADRRASVNSGNTYVPFDTEVECAGGSSYRFVIDNNASATDCLVSVFTVSTASHRGAYPGGTACALTTSTDGTTWVDTTTTVPLIRPVFSALDDGAGGAGGLMTHPGMSGGMRG